MSPHPLFVFAIVPHVYAGALLAVASRRPAVWTDGQFTRAKFYALMGWAPLTYLVLALAVSWRYAVMFFACGVAGVVGELIVSVAWRLFFPQPIWTYSHGALAGAFTSTLNFLPWAVGALLFHVIGYPLRVEWRSAVLVTVSSLMAGVVLLWLPYLALRRRRFDGFGFAVFCAPITLVAVGLAVWCDVRYALLMIAFSIAGFLTEYGYGRTMGAFFHQPLWRYNPWPLDHGHASSVSVPLWALGGLFFFFICRAIGL